MKNLFLSILVAALFILAPTALAQTTDTKHSRTGEVVTLESDEVIDRDYFASGDKVEIYGTVNGDVYAAGSEIIIDATINGDLLAAGGTVNIGGTITQNVRVIGGNVNISADIGRNLTIGAGNADIENSAEISGSLVAGAGNINLVAPIEGNVMVGAGNLTIANRVGGDVEAGVSQLRLTSKAAVGGVLSYFSDQEASIAKEATVSGLITRNEPSRAFMARDLGVSKKEAGSFLTTVRKTTRVLSFLSTLLVGLLLIHFYPKYSRQAANTLRKKPWASLGVGFAALILTPIAVIFIGITIIGIPIALILLATYLIYLYLAKIFVILWVGIIVSERASRKMTLGWTFVLGLIIYSVATLIPVIGGFTHSFTLIFGLGAMLLTCKEVYVAAKKKEII